jgi:hypothetical protein
MVSLGKYVSVGDFGDSLMTGRGCLLGNEGDEVENVGEL